MQDFTIAIQKRKHMNINTLTITILLLLIQNCFSQISGNQAYKDYSYSNRSNYNQFQSFSTTDSTLVIKTKIMMNMSADFYLITLAVNEESKTLEEGLKKINSRITNFTSSLKKIKVKNNAFYIDFISQAKLYDYNINKNTARQFESGFVIKKNIIVKLNDIKKFDKLLELASQENIFDIVKVDYKNTDTKEISDKLYSEAVNIIENKKEIFIKNSSKKLNGVNRILTSNFYSVYPKTQYQKYQAVESNNISTYSKNNFIKKDAIKSNTFFYEGVPISGFDKIINNNTPEIGIQYILELSKLFEITN